MGEFVTRCTVRLFKLNEGEEEKNESNKLGMERPPAQKEHILHLYKQLECSIRKESESLQSATLLPNDLVCALINTNICNGDDCWLTACLCHIATINVCGIFLLSFGIFSFFSSILGIYESTGDNSRIWSLKKEDVPTEERKKNPNFLTYFLENLKDDNFRNTHECVWFSFDVR